MINSFLKAIKFVIHAYDLLDDDITKKLIYLMKTTN